MKHYAPFFLGSLELHSSCSPSHTKSGRGEFRKTLPHGDNATNPQSSWRGEMQYGAPGRESINMSRTKLSAFPCEDFSKPWIKVVVRLTFDQPYPSYVTLKSLYIIQRTLEALSSTIEARTAPLHTDYALQLCTIAYDSDIGPLKQQLTMACTHICNEMTLC